MLKIVFYKIGFYGKMEFGGVLMIEKLFELQDLKYRDFHARLMPTVDKDRIIGVRVPILRKFAKSVAGTKEAEDFLKKLPHKYYEENNLHAFLIEEIKDFDGALSETERFLPYIDNWATCDMFYPKVFKKNYDRLYGKIDEWIADGSCYKVRYAVGLLLRGNFTQDDMEKVAGVRCGEYYVDMMIAWYFATALCKNYNDAIEYIKEGKLSCFVHNKAIQKAVESHRTDKDTKEYLKTLKRGR